ncbi:Protein of unknown function [Prauserella marina]|uniref:Uncharacterized protein n=1 Tax=Prauserella marina TaxID=530584 RepID=A0A1G6ZQD9_9PSEU|nr:uncharacterized protein DUF4237 [Prauserella marina]SDE03766.1 Protein of unknown function [Prauserella marina]
MALPTQLNATEQDTLVKQIGLSLLRAAPRDWRRVTAEYRAVGRYHELTGEVVVADGSTEEWMATHDIATLFGRLRAGMYREGRGTWFNARYQLDHPSSYNLEYDRDEPQWDLAPPPQAYADELRTFPRSEENVPDWLMRRMSGLGPERPGHRFRIARIFDGPPGPNGRPVINRPELDVDEQDRLLDYLDSSPVVVPGRGYDLDRLANPPESTVPIAFHSDGAWIWPAAVNYYLREYGLAPEPDLIQHIRGNGFSIPDVPEPVRQAASAHINRGGVPPQQRPVPPPPPEPEQAVAEEPEPLPPFEEQFAEHAAEPTRFAEPVRHDDGPPHDRLRHDEPEPEDIGYAGIDNVDDDPGRAGDDLDRIDGRNGLDGLGGLDGLERREGRDRIDDIDNLDTLGSLDDLDERGEHADHGDRIDVDENAATTIAALPPLSEPPAREEEQTDSLLNERIDDRPRPPAHLDGTDDGGPPTQFSSPPPMYEEPVLEDLHDKLEDLGIPEAVYRIGAPAEHGWSVEQVAEGWRVGWYDEELKSPAVFGDAEDAAAFMLGKVLLAPGGATTPPVQPAQPAPPAAPAPEERQPPPPRPVTTTLSPEVATGMRPPPPPREQPPAEQPTRLSAPVTPREEPSAGARRQAPAPGPREAPQPPPARRDGPPRPAEADQRKGGGQWPIHPMSGEPPLTLFRGKEVRELPAGSELDRFGGPNGNLTYAAGTPFEERSLVPEWVSRPYHVYRVQRPLEALHGVAIPWFNQPGGGAAYLLPASIEELLAEGDLIELDPGEPPID